MKTMKTKHLSIVFALISLVVLISGCADNDSTIANVEDNDFQPIVLTQEQETMVSAGNAFAMTLLEKVNAEQKGSFIISPISLQFVLGMVLNGAEGEVADEICRVLGFGSGEMEAVNDFYSRLIHELPDLDKLTQFTTVRSGLSSVNEPLKQSYIDAVSSKYEALFESVDFINNPQAVREKVNLWCSQNTNGMIPEMITEAETKDLGQVALMLLDATWFKGVWNIPFEKKNTEHGRFTREDGSTCRVPFMKSDGRMNVSGGSIYRAVKKYYGNGAYSMTVILPDKNDGVESVLALLHDGRDLVFSTQSTELWLPKFEIETSVDNYIPILNGMGMKKVFVDGALTQVFERRDIGCLNLIKQKSAIKVDEIGTEAASVTEAVVMDGSLIPNNSNSKVIFHADHPFIYLITEESTGTILFAGVYRGE